MKFSARTWMFIAMLYMAYVIYGTLLPFDFSFSFDLIRMNLQDIEWIDRYGRAFFSTRNVDAIANFIFFIPLGFIYYNVRYAACAGGVSSLRMVFTATLWGLIFSGAIELTQLLIMTRKTSFIDLITNTTGGGVGAVFAAIIPRIISVETMALLRKLINRLPHFLWLIPLIILSLSFPENFSMYFLKSEEMGNVIFNWQYIIKPYWIWQFLFLYIPMGIVITRMVRSVYQPQTLIKAHLLSFFIAFVLTGLLEFLRWRLYRTIPVPVNMLYALLGILTGIALTEILIKPLQPHDKAIRGRVIPVLCAIIFYLFAIVVYKYTFPFIPETDMENIHRKLMFFFLSINSFIPFNSILKLFVYSMQNILLFLPIGMVAMELEFYLAEKWKSRVLFSLAAILIVLPVVLQLINREQIPFLYEIPANAIGFFMGYFAWYIFRRMDNSVRMTEN